MLFRSKKLKQHKSVGVLIVCHFLTSQSWRDKWHVSLFNDFISRLSLETKPCPKSWPTLSIVWRQLKTRSWAKIDGWLCVIAGDFVSDQYSSGERNLWWGAQSCLEHDVERYWSVTYMFVLCDLYVDVFFVLFALICFLFLAFPCEPTENKRQLALNTCCNILNVHI